MAAESAVRIIFLGDSAQAVRSVSRLEGAFGTLGRTTKLAAGAMGIALVGGLVAATKAAVDFQSSMELVHTQAGASTKEVEKMSVALLKMAASVGTAPNDLAKALFHIESAGIHGTKALQMLRFAAEGAKVGQADLVDVTNTLIATQKSGIKGVGSMSHAMGVLNAIVGAGNMHLQDLTSALGTGLLQNAGAVGLKLTDVGAALDVLTAKGMNAASASTRLSMGFFAMASQTPKADAALKAIGLTHFALANDMRSPNGLLAALTDLSTRMQKAGLTANEQTQVISDVFGRRSVSAVLGLIQNLNDYQGRLKAVTDHTAAFGDAWVATTHTAEFQMARAKAAIAAAAIPIGSVLLPAIAKIAGGIGTAASAFLDFERQVARAPNLGAKFKVLTDFAHGLAQELQGALKGIDWAMVGGDIAKGIVGGIKITADLAQKVVAALGNALASVNWDAVARKAGPFIVTALASAISAATDPSFWMHHWDLALSIALVAFGGAVGKIAGRLGELLLRPFAGLGERFAVIAGDIIVKFADRLPRGLQTVFRMAADLAFRALFALGEKAGAVGDDIVSNIKSRVAKIPGLLRFTFKVLGVDAAIHMMGQFASYVVAKVGQAIHFVINILGQIPGAVRAAFAFTGVGAAINMIQTLVHWIQTLIGWIAKIPNINLHVHLPSLPTPHMGNFHGIPYPTFAKGGFIAGQSGSPQMILAHAGEVILNPMQQAAFGGAGFFKKTFGFTGGEGPGFASGGIVNKRHKPHHGHPVRSRYKTASRAARGDLKSVDQINQEEADADRAYGQLSRQYQIDGTLDPTEIDSLIAARQHMLDLLEQERKALLKAIKDLHRAIAMMTVRLKAERKKKKPNTALISTLTSGISDFQRSVGDEKLNLFHQLPFDKRDVQLDIADLKQQKAGAVSASGPDLSTLLAEIAQLNLALGIQTAQQGVIGSFAKGTLSVPETGLALVHAGEQIVPAGRTRDTGSSSQPAQVNIIVDDAMGWLKPFIRAEAVNASDAISVRIGQRATERARSGRY